ncbi:MAG TPA: hypothetical protein VNO26_06105, partial [Candidatus Limnocylindria bacterium]|nr:hypothetical protein [Candidatus Limnocylindria bacterium]
MALEEELVDVAALRRVHGVEAEIIEDEEFDADEAAHLLFDGVIEAGVLEGLEEPIGADGAHGGAAGAGEVAERVGEEGRADADGADDGDVFVLVEKAQGRELAQQPVSTWTSSPGPQSAIGTVGAVRPKPSTAIAKRRSVGYGSSTPWRRKS